MTTKTHDNDRAILRELAGKVAEIAHEPVQEERKRLWRQLNGLRPERPLVLIDQVCWHEMDVDGELALRCEDAECRAYETHLRRTLYQCRHFPVDRVVEPRLRVPMAVKISDLGPSIREQVAVTDPDNPVVSHAYVNQFESDEDLEKIRMPTVRHDAVETARRLEKAHELFDGVLEVTAYGVDPYLSVWDPISMWMGAENALLALAERPDFMRALAARMVSAYHALLDQLEHQHLLCDGQPLIHCTGAWTDDLPAPGFDPRKPRTRDLWMFGLAQMFASASPEMFEEFEINLCLPIFERFGLVYYGCCDPLDRNMAAVKRIPNVRKVSMSPWADEERGAREIGSEYVFSRKPNPALLATELFSEEGVRKHLRTTVDICRRYGCPLELILKDISTVRRDPRRLWKWADIAMDIVRA
jgi:hypothetical protein